jgi:hypothetical protein
MALIKASNSVKIRQFDGCSYLKKKEHKSIPRIKASSGKNRALAAASWVHIKHHACFFSQSLQKILTIGSFIRAYVSRGPPKQAPQLGLAGVSQPASSKIWEQVQSSSIYISYNMLQTTKTHLPSKVINIH